MLDGTNITFVLIGGGALLAAAATLAWTQLRGTTKETVHQLVKKQCPIGSSKEQVYEFLRKNGIRAGGYNAGPDPYAGLPDEERQWKRYLVAWIPENSNPSVSKYTISIYFYFDENYTL